MSDRYRDFSRKHPVFGFLSLFLRRECLKEIERRIMDILKAVWSKRGFRRKTLNKMLIYSLSMRKNKYLLNGI